MPKMLFQNKCLHLLIIILSSLLLNTGCGSSMQTSPPGYDLSKPHRTELGKALNEISGLSFSVEDSSLLAISDSKKRVFQMDLKVKTLKDYSAEVIPGNSDIEDIVKIDTSVFVLMSKGVIIEMPLRAADTTNIKFYDLELGGSNDFETLYYDPSAEGLIMLCKTCAPEKGTGVRTAYRFNLRTRTFDDKSFFTLSKGQVKTLLKNDDADFEPSGAAIHPIEKRLYILSGTKAFLIIADIRGQVLEAYNLHPDFFRQAEGIAFAPNGDLYISNEKKDGAPPTLLRFPYISKAQKKQ
ncbi:MAG: SdiA-regulated domain-containing protein [Chitinophagaceae bacterium]